MELNIDKTGWKKVKFGEVCTQQKGIVDIETTSLTRYIAGDHMNSNDIHLRKWGTLGDGYLGPAFIRKFEVGDILYGSRRTYLKKVAVADFEGITSNTTFVIKADERKINTVLLSHLMLSDSFTEHSVKNSKGSVNPYINWKDIADYEFLLPPKDQQDRLAELLWAADEVVEREREVFNSIETYHKSFLKEKYQDVNQPLIKFSDLVIVNPSIKRNDNQEQLGSFISMSDVSNDGKLIGKEDKPIKELQGNGFTPFLENDILFAKITPCMENGKGAIAKGLANGVGFGSTEFHVLKPKQESDLMFCFYLTKMDLFRQNAERLMTGSAGQKRVQSDFFDYFKFHAPNKNERKSIGEKLEQIQENVAYLNTSIVNANLLKQRLINELY